MTTQKAKAPKAKKGDDLPPEPGSVSDLAAAVWMDARELVPWAGNYNRHPDEQLKSLRAAIALAWTETIVARRDGLTVISGHGRLEAAMLEIEENPAWTCAGAPGPCLVPVRLVDVTAEEAEELAIAANEIARQGLPDERQLGRVIEGIRVRARGRELADAQVERMGLRRQRVAELLQKARKKTPADVNDPPDFEIPDQPVSELGVVYELGPHRVLCGEALDLGNLRKLLDGRPADHAFMDPPYAIYGSATGIGPDIADDGMIRPFFQSILLHTAASVRKFGLVWICCDWRSWASWWEMAKGTPLQVKNKLIWRKPGGLGNQYMQTYEEIAFLTHQPSRKALTSNMETGARPVLAPNLFEVPPDALDEREVEYEDEVIAVNRVSGEARKHNAQKPIALIEAAIRPGVRPGEVILDLFAGSGSTLIAAERLGLHARLVEQKPGWVDVIRRRWTIFADDLGIDAGPGALR